MSVAISVVSADTSGWVQTRRAAAKIPAARVRRAR
jgi:hypothetical protein